MRGTVLAACLAMLCTPVFAQAKRILYITHSAGFRHDSLPVSAQVMRDVAARSGKLEVVASEDVSLLNAATLREFDAVFFFTSGELPVSDQQKRDLLDFVRQGKGFGGAHSATDTFYTWPEYGDLIGARFNGHPWVQSVTLSVEDPSHPAAAPVSPSLTILDEIYQFREFSRDRVRVLLSLDTHSVNMGAAGVNSGTEDFPSTWVRPYGAGRVFYTALGHFDETWRDARFQQMLSGAMLWLTGQAQGDASPRPKPSAKILPEGIANAASFAPRNVISPGSLITLFGDDLTAGASIAADAHDPPYKLGGTVLKINGGPAPLLYVSPKQINAYVPLEAKPISCQQPLICRGQSFVLDVTPAGGDSLSSVVDAADMTPGVFTLTSTRVAVTLWTTGLGPVQRRGLLDYTVAQPQVNIGGVPALVTFSGLAPGWVGLYQVDATIPPGTAFPAPLEFRVGDSLSRAMLNP